MMARRCAGLHTRVLRPTSNTSESGPEDDPGDRTVTGQHFQGLQVEDVSVEGFVTASGYVLQGGYVGEGDDVGFLPAHYRGVAVV
jgi:hypothetical protein